MKTKENKIRELWKHRRISFAIVIVAVLFMAIVSVSAAPNLPASPAQNAIKQAIADGNFSAADIEGNPEYTIEILEQNESHIKFKANTKIIFKNPRGAGYNNNGWPKFEINKTEGNIKAGNYDQQIKDSILSEIKNIKDETERSKKLKEWNNYDFENGSRIYEFSEIYEATYPNASALKSAFTKILPNNTNNILPSNIYNNYVLMGFTDNVHWTYSKQENLYLNLIFWHPLIAWARVDAILDAVLGLRLPTIVGLDIPNIMVRGQSYTLNTNINGQDWDAAQYSAANVPSENGNEFIARGQASITIQGWARIIGDIGPYYLYNRGFDYSKSFQTPFGPYQEFPIPDLYLSPDQTGLKIYCCANLLWGGIGLKIDPNLGSDKITANWNTGGDSIGSGSMEYNMPNINYYFGPVTANDYSTTTDYANIRLSDYKYYFTICSLTLGANIQGGLTFLPLTIQTGYLDLYTYNCAGITGNHYLGIHQGTTANSITGNSLVENYLTVTSPNGGENWMRGATKIIRWTSVDNIGNVKIDLLKGGIVDRDIALSTPNSGSYSWTIPVIQTLGNDYKVRITSTTNSAYTDTSDNNFIISSPSITVTSPNGGENWQRGTTKTIRWKSNGPAGIYVKIELLKGLIVDKVISSSTINWGSYDWHIPSTQTLGSDYKIRVTSTSNSAYTDTSNNNFIISSPTSITVTYPNGGESWRRGTIHTISWTSAGNTGSNVKIELFKSGVLNRVISSNTPNDGSFSWTVPSTQILGSDYKIKITSTSNSAYNDLSNNYFRIFIA